MINIWWNLYYSFWLELKKIILSFSSKFSEYLYLTFTLNKTIQKVWIGKNTKKIYKQLGAQYPASKNHQLDKICPEMCTHVEQRNFCIMYWKSVTRDLQLNYFSIPHFPNNLPGKYQIYFLHHSCARVPVKCERSFNRCAPHQ